MLKVVTTGTMDLFDLLERVRKLPPMTTRESEEQRLNFAYGQLAASTMHKPKRAAFWMIAYEKFHWTNEQFDAWADKKEWWG